MANNDQPLEPKIISDVFSKILLKLSVSFFLAMIVPVIDCYIINYDDTK